MFILSILNSMWDYNKCVPKQGHAQTFSVAVYQPPPPPPPQKKGHWRAGLLINTYYPVVTNIQLKEKTAHSVMISDFIVSLLIRVGSPSRVCFCLLFNGSRGEWGKMNQCVNWPTPCILATVHFYCHVTMYIGTTHHFYQTLKRRNLAWTGKQQ